MDKVAISPKNKVYDASFMTLFQSCERKCYWKHFHGGYGISVPREPIALAFGSAIHEGLPVWEMGGTIDEAVATAVKRFVVCEQEDEKRSILTIDNLIRGYVEHYQTPMVYRKDSAGKPMLEMEFSIPLLGTDITLRGRLDGVGEVENEVWVVDKKTSSSFSSYFLEKFRRDIQMKTYFWALHSMIGSCRGVMIDLLKVTATAMKFVSGTGKRDQRNVDEYYHRQPLIMDDYSIVTYEAFVKSLDKKVSTCLATNEWIENYGECFQYGECPFMWLCEMPDKVEALIEQRFVYNKE